MSMALGHKTQYLNWRRVVDALPGDVAPTWVPIPSTVEDPVLRRLPLPAGTRRKLSDWLTTRRGLRRGPFDAVLLNPHGLAVKHQRALSAQPTFLALDATRRQFESFSRWYAMASSEEGLLGSLRHQRQRRALQAAAGLFPASRWAARSLIDDYGVDPARVHTVPIGVDPELWRPRPELKPRDGKVRLLFVGGQFERKGGVLLLRWARRTLRRDWELHLVTNDPGPLPPHVVHHRAANNSGGLIALAQQCDLFVLPTRADCSSIAALEAMSTGMPAVSTTVGGVPELIVEGQTGHVIPPDDADALHERLDALLAAPEKLAGMGRAARERVLREYDARALVKRALSIMQAAT
jgi:glycosyltransferase involved in cell wall biosynthesis